MRAALAFRRTEHGHIRELDDGREAMAPLRELDIDLPLTAVCDSQDVAPEPEESDRRRARSPTPTRPRAADHTHPG